MRPERGFALVAALFVMVVIGLAVAAMSRLSVTQTASVDLLLQQARAYQAARAGLEWGVARVLGTIPPGCRETEVEFMVDAANVTVSVECPNLSPPPLPEEGTFYHLKAKAEVGELGSPDYAWRQIETVVETEAP